MTCLSLFKKGPIRCDGIPPGTKCYQWISKRGLKVNVVVIIVSLSSVGSPVGPLEGLWCHSESPITGSQDGLVRVSPWLSGPFSVAAKLLASITQGSASRGQVQGGSQRC
jgi:hypothetical protein